MFTRLTQFLRKPISLILGYNKTKKRLDIASDPKDLLNDESYLNQKSTEDTGESSSQKRKFDIASDEDSNDEDKNDGIEVMEDRANFRPMVAFSSWLEPRTTTKRLTVAIVLLTGVGISDFSVFVVASGDYIELKCLWPQEVVNVETLHRKWLLSDKEGDKIENYHPNLLGFESFLKNLRRRASDAIESVCRIVLPFMVETHVYSKSNLQWRDSTTRIVYIELRVAVEEYGIDNKTEEEFELV